MINKIASIVMILIGIYLIVFVIRNHDGDSVITRIKGFGSGLLLIIMGSALFFADIPLYKLFS